MKKVSILLRVGIGKFRNCFYNNTITLMLYLMAFILLRIFQVEYKIRDFKFLYAFILLAFGNAVFEFYYSQRLKRKLKLITTCLIIAVIFIITVIQRQIFISQVKNMFENYTIIQQAFYGSKETSFSLHLPILIINLPVLMAIALLLESKGYGWIVLISSLIYLFILWYAGELWEVRLYVLAYIITASIIYCLEAYKRSSFRYEKKGVRVSVNLNKIINYILVLSVAIGFISYAAVKLAGTKSAFAAIRERLTSSRILVEKSKLSRFDLSSSGYNSSSGKLGGPVKLSYDTAFKVSAEEPLYLKAVTKDFYDGYRWTKTDNIYEKKDKDKLKQTSAKYLQYLKQVKDDSAAVKSLTIYPNLLDTSTIMIPNYIADIGMKKGYVGSNADGDYMLLGKDKINDAYKVAYYKSSLGIEKFSEIYKNHIALGYVPGDNTISDKYSKYLQLPDNISKVTYELAKTIIKDSKTVEDKIYNIQEYLSKNYKYSLNVSEVPEGKEFTDYFLFSEKKGYCTYFATSAAVLCRISGIPARYVEGFSMGNKKDAEGLYDVTNDMAHAWVEVLVAPDLDIWSILDSVPEAEKEVAIDNSTSSISRYPSGTELNLTEEASDTNKEKSLYIRKVITYSVLSAGAVSCIFIILTLVRAAIFEANRRKLLKEDKLAPLYDHVRHRLSVLGDKIPEDDFEWLEKIPVGTLREALEELIKGVYQEFYGKKEKLEVDRNRIFTVIEDNLKQRQGKVKYFLLKYYSSIK